jgi:uncharacterized protein
MNERRGGARIRQAALLALVALLVGCFSGLREIGAPSPPTRFYSLSAVATPGETLPGEGLGLSPVRIPNYLDRPQIVTRTGPNDLALADFDRWGESLQEAVSRVLAANLSRQLGVDRVQRYPWREARAVTIPIDVDVLRMEGPLEGPVALEALWQLRLREGTFEGTTRTSEEVDGRGYSAYAAALSRTLATLSEEIAAAIRARRPTAGPGSGS